MSLFDLPGSMTVKALRAFPGLPPFYGECKVALRDARPLSGWPSAVLLMVPPFAAEPMRQGGCQGWGAAPPTAQRRALALTQEPGGITLRAFQGGWKAAEGQVQAEHPAPGARGRPCLGRQPRAAWQRCHRPPAGVAKPPYLQERSVIRRAPSERGMGGERKPWHGQSAAAPMPSFIAPWGAAR